MQLTQRHKKYPPPHNTVSVLLIEDDPAACKLVERTLGRNDSNVKFELETVQDMASAKETLTQKRFDNILLDLGLPDSSGIQSVKNIHKISPDIPIIVLSALTDSNMEMLAIREGADHYLIKEQSIYQDLCKSIRFAIERKSKERKNNHGNIKSQDETKDADILKKELDSANSKCMHLELLNEQLRKSCKATQASSKIVGIKLQEGKESLAHITHELRAPLNSIIGFSDILSQQKLSDTHSEYVQFIKDESATLLELINNILDLSKIEAEKMELDCKSFHLQDFLDQIKTLLAHSATSKGIAFRVITSPDLPECITTDPVRLRQCLVNLLVNAIKFTASGHVHLTVLVEKDGDDKKIRFEIEDTGIGISKYLHDKIFHAFAQADSSTAIKYGGTGLGLSITKKLTEMLDGTVYFTSKPGYGSTFSISIPLNIKPPKQYNGSEVIRTRKTSTAAAPEFSGTVLVIEEDPKARLLINLRLNDLGLDVEIARNDDHAIELAATGKIDIIFTSVGSPEMNEISIVEKIRNKGLTVPMVAIIETTDRATIIDCVDSGCNGYITKPILKNDLYQALERFLQSDRECVKSTGGQN